MTFEQITLLVEILDIKVTEGLNKLRELSIDTIEYQNTLNNIIASTTIANKLRINGTDQQTTEGEN